VPIECHNGEELVGKDCKKIECHNGEELVGNDCQPTATTHSATHLILYTISGVNSEGLFTLKGTLEDGDLGGGVEGKHITFSES
jgi:hypothetical protein